MKGGLGENVFDFGEVVEGVEGGFCGGGGGVVAGEFDEVVAGGGVGLAEALVGDGAELFELGGEGLLADAEGFLEGCEIVVAGGLGDGGGAEEAAGGIGEVGLGDIAGVDPDLELLAREEIGKLAGAGATRDKMIAGYEALATEIALQGNKDEAIRLTNMAMSLAAQQTAQMELEIKKQRLEQQREAQRLAREKFEAAERRLQAVKNAVANAKREGGLSAEALAQIEEAAGLL